MEKIYRNVPFNLIPWNIATPPETLVNLFKSGKIVPGKAVDLGCGTGHYALYMAKNGFDVTGIDISPTAIQIAKKTAEERKISCCFIVADVLGSPNIPEATFDFAYDWELLHHIFPEKREIYIENVYRLLKPAGKYFSLCFSENDSHFGGKGKYRETPLGTILYLSSEDELRALFTKRFDILDLRTIKVPGKKGSHLAVCGFMQKIR